MNVHQNANNCLHSCLYKMDIDTELHTIYHTLRQDTSFKQTLSSNKQNLVQQWCCWARSATILSPQTVYCIIIRNLVLAV